MRRWVVVTVCGLVVLAACSSSSSHAGSPQPSSTTAGGVPTTTARTAPDTQVWLCKPGRPGNPCTASLDSTAIGPDGAKTVTKVAPAADPKIDCFYVYPTVSQQTTPNANLDIDPAEVGVVVAQAARYSQVCHVYAPIYRQVPIAGLATRNAKAGPIAFQRLLSAWKDYLARYNDGRGIVLIGHSQGAFILRQLISKYIEPDASVRTRIVSAILLGGNVIVPTGKDVGGDFKYLKCVSQREPDGLRDRVLVVRPHSTGEQPVRRAPTKPASRCCAPTPPRSPGARDRPIPTSRRAA